MLTEESSRFALPDRPADQAGAPGGGLGASRYGSTPIDRCRRIGIPAYLDRRVYQGSSGRVYPLPFLHQIADEPHRPGMARGPPGERVAPPHGAAGARRAHPRGPQERRRHDFFYEPRDQARAGGPGRARGWPAASSSTGRSTTVRRPTCRRTSTIERGAGRRRHRLVLRPRPVHPDEGHARGAAAAGQRGARAEGAAVQPQTSCRRRSCGGPTSRPRSTTTTSRSSRTDVTFVADHARRAITAFPPADRPYYGIDYPRACRSTSRTTAGSVVPGDRLDWYRNIPVPTSYMCLAPRGDFFGGYDHAPRRGFVHVADHALSPGKKQWTWGNAAVRQRLGPQPDRRRRRPTSS